MATRPSHEGKVHIFISGRHSHLFYPQRHFLQVSVRQPGNGDGQYWHLWRRTIQWPSSKYRGHSCSSSLFMLL
jgi:hypothetical protein